MVAKVLVELSNKNIDKTTKVTAFDRNAFFKEMIVTRMYDKPL